MFNPLLNRFIIITVNSCFRFNTLDTFVLSPMNEIKSFYFKFCCSILYAKYAMGWSGSMGERVFPHTPQLT